MSRESMGDIANPEGELDPRKKEISPVSKETSIPKDKIEISNSGKRAEMPPLENKTPDQSQKMVEELEKTRAAMEQVVSILAGRTEVNISEIIAQAVTQLEMNKGEKISTEEARARLATEMPSETMKKFEEGISKISGLRPGELPPPKGLKEGIPIEDQRKWVWGVLERIAQTGTRFGASENYADSLALSQARSFLNPDLLKEIDSLTLMYNQFVNFANAPDLGQAEQLTSSIRGDHFKTLMKRPEIMRSFRLWEKYAQSKGKDKNTDSILVLKGDKLDKQRMNLRNELMMELSQVGSYEYKNQEDLLLAATVGLQFGEFLWRTSERAAILDSDLTKNGSGEYFLRRLFYGGKAAEKDIVEGRSRGKIEVARRLNYGLLDWYSTLGEKFWLGAKEEGKEKEEWKWEESSPQPKEVFDWYLRMKKEGKVEKDGKILDLSDCPLDKINFLATSTNPNSGIMTGHYAIQLIGAEKTRAALAEPGSFLEAPTIENFMKLKGLFSNLNFYTENSLIKQENAIKVNDEIRANIKAGKNGNLEDITTISTFRQEAYKEIFDGMVDYLLNRKLVSRETIAGYVEVASAKDGGLFEEKGRQEEMKKLFRFPYWLEIPLRRINYIGGILAIFFAALKASLSQK